MHESSSYDPGTSGGNRRDFLAKSAAVLAGGTALAVPAVAGVTTFLNPLRQKSEGGQFLRLASLDALPSDGTPVRVPVCIERSDAWNRYPKESVGAVYLRRVDNGVLALQVFCPHGGCAVNYDEKGKQFACPCHAQPRFDLEGKRVDGAKSFSPRDMDSLDVEIRSQNEVWVKFQTFLYGTTKKIAQA